MFDGDEFGRVCWPMGPRAAGETRPAKLVSALIELGVIRHDASYESHGAKKFDGRRSAGSLVVGSRNGGLARRTAVLSPLFLLSEASRAGWIDVYDDWSLAPDVRLPNRALSYAGYKRIKKASGFVSTNTVYMQGRIGGRSTIVPNGVDTRLATVGRGVDDTPTMVILGKYFNGRTDWKLFEALLHSSWGICDVRVYGAPDAFRRKVLESRPRAWSSRWFFNSAQPFDHIAADVGPNSILAIPHRVSDYTLSQDLMKAYQAVALGFRVLVPLDLMPRSIPIQYQIAISRGVELRSLLDGIFRRPVSISLDERAEFAESNSWARRAEVIANNV